LAATSVIDNLWAIACHRADLAGQELARALLLRKNDSRGVTLVGFSMGARVIFSCLKTLCSLRLGTSVSGSDCCEIVDDDTYFAEVNNSNVGLDFMKSCDASADVGDKSSARSNSSWKSWSGIGRDRSHAAPEDVLEVPLTATDQRRLDSLVLDVVLLGAPIASQSFHWDRVRRLVNGRLINGYSENDLMLGIIYKLNRLRIGVAGVNPVISVGVENIDLSDIVETHLDYQKKMKAILQRLHLGKCQ